MDKSTTSCMALALAITFVLVAVAQAGCKDTNLCCTGRDNDCKTQGFRQHREDVQKNDTDLAKSPKILETMKKLTVCYCDEHCSAQGDCCDDYEKTCPAKDCELGEWEEWGECSVRCGVGIRERVRPVLTKPQHGGQPCDTKLQKGYCEANKCKTARHSYGFAIRETGKLVPATFGSWRKAKQYNPYKDIRKNLFRHYRKSNEIIRRPSYCAKYELTKVGRACQSKAAKTWVKVLKQGATLCVECQSFSMKRNLGVRCRGHGVYLKETAWNAVASPGCRGEWVMQSEHEECSCDPTSDHSFILI